VGAIGSATYLELAGRAFAIMANRIETRPQQRGDPVDRSAALRKVMEVLSVKGFANTSIADLASAAGVGNDALHKAFGAREEILRAAIRFCADAEASLAHEPLRVSPTGREAILSLLEENVRLRRRWPKYCGCLFTFNAFIVPPEDAGLHEFLTERRRSLSKHIRLRLTQSVSEGELPERTNCEALANLCLTLLSGLMIRALDGTPPGPLFRSVELFVNAVGFEPRRQLIRRRVPRRSRPRQGRNR
jgi:AcrR family transcriptional regulator